MKPAILYMLTSLRTTGGTTAKIRSTFKYTKFKVFIAVREGIDQKTIEEWERLDKIKYIKTCPKNFIKTLLILNKTIRKENINIVHAFFPYETYIAYTLKLFNRNLKVIRSFEGPVERKRIIKILSKITLPSFDKLIFISKYVKDYYAKLTKNHKSKVIIDNSAYHNYTFSERTKGNICKLIDVAGLNPIKNIFMHAEIGRVLKSRNFPFVIKIAGDGPYRERLENLIREYDIQKEVILLGNQVNPQKYYEEADIFIHPADLEGFGIVVPEAMSSGLPVILSDKGALPELVTNLEDGIIVDAYNPEEWADAIIKLHNDRELYKKLAGNAYKTYKKRFTPDIYARKLDDVYTDLISK